MAGRFGRPNPPPTFPAFEHENDVQAIAASQNAFTRDLYLALVKEKKANIFFSPFSIMTAVAMTHLGTRGKTEEEIRSVLHLPENKTVIKNAFKDLVSNIKKKVDEYELHTANMAYVSHKLSVLDDFATSLSECFFSVSKTVDFGNSEPVRHEINTAVEKETNSLIKDLIAPGILTSDTRMVLVNAVYFKGLWQTQFKEEDTYDEPFWISATESIDTPMMHAKENFRLAHLKDLDATLLSMEYQGGRLSMVIVLPNEQDGLAKLEAKLPGIELQNLDKRVPSVKVKVTIPKFKLEESLELVDTLKGMGIKDLFSGSSCDLSGISGNRDLYVSNVIHKAFVEVNEKGTEAAAATGMIMVNYCSKIPKPRFVADHPFYFYIRDGHSGLVLFTGRIARPTIDGKSKDEL